MTLAQSRDVLGQIRNFLNRRKYIQNLVSEVQKTLIPSQPATSHGNRLHINRPYRRHRPRHHQQPGGLHGSHRALGLFPGADGDKLVPSVVSIAPDGDVVVGNPARELLLTQPERTVYSVKRLMGRGLADVQEELKLFPFHVGSRQRIGDPAPARRSHVSPRPRSRR